MPIAPELIQMEDDEGDDQWSSQSIRQMLEAYLQNVEKFRNSKMRKKNTWGEVSKAVGKPPESCDRKFRNLKQTYLRLLKKKTGEGVTAFKWPYFELFEEIYCVNGEYQPVILEKLQEKPETSITTPAKIARLVPEVIYENGESSQTEEVKKKVYKKKFTEFKKIATEMRDRQRTVEAKLDRLINIVEESNSIQKERNRLFESYLQRLEQNPLKL